MKFTVFLLVCWSTLLGQTGIDSAIYRTKKKIVESCNKEIKKNRHNATAYFDRGQAKMLYLDKTGALEDFNKVIELDPKFPRAFYFRAGIKYDLKDYLGAKQDYTSALEIESDNDRIDFIYRGRARCNIHLKDSTGACNDYKKAAGVGDSTGLWKNPWCK